MSSRPAAASTSTQKVFICYRRDETAGHAGRLHDALANHLGGANVFMDVELEPGVDFEERITEILSGCVAVIVVIGPNWSTVEGQNGGRRLDDPEDLVRIEVETGLAKAQSVYPVLVGGAQMPRRENLPESLRPLTRRNAQELSNGRWAYDVSRLVSTLDELVPALEPEPGSPPPPPGPPAPSWWLVLEGMLVAGITAGVARVIGQGIPLNESTEIKKAVRLEEPILDGESSVEKAQHIAGLMGRRTETLALVGGVLAIWLAHRIRRIYPLRHLLRGLLVGAVAGLVGGLIWGLRVYLPEETVSFATRANWDILTGAISGGILASLVGWFWRPRRVGPAIVAGAVGGVLAPLFIVLTDWRNTTPPIEPALSFALFAAAVAGVTVAAMLVADRAEGRTGVQAPAEPD